MPIRQMMSAILAVAFVFGVTAKSSSAVADAQSAEALVAKARALEDLRLDGAKPFLMRATVTVSEKKGAPSEGEYGLNWWATDRWQERVKFADFGRGREGVKGGYWQSRPTDFQPEAIFNMDRALDPIGELRLNPNEMWGKVSEDKNHGDALSCVAVNWKKELTRTLCFEQSSGKLVRIKYGGAALSSTIEYSEFTAFGEKQFPGKIVMSAKDEPTVEVSVSKLAALTAPAPADVAKVSNSEFWAQCDGETPAQSRLIKQVQPKYPDESKSNHEQGSVKMYIKIEADGSVTHLRVLSSPAQRLAQAAADAVSQWRYTPTTCSSTPVATESLVTVVFTLGG